MTRCKVLLLPGWQNSGPSHWQSRWQHTHGYERVEQHDWMRPRRGDWIARLQEVVLEHAAHRSAGAPADLVLVAHSLGCMLVAAWAAQTRLSHHVRGALLVAPGDPQRDEVSGALPSWFRIPDAGLPFDSVLLGSHDDPYCSFERAQQFARAWGSEFIDCGRCGPINAEPGLGDWPQGHALLMQRFAMAPAPTTAHTTAHTKEG